MSKPNNLIAKVKLPGENDQRPIVPYQIGSTVHSHTASLPADMTADGVLALRSDIENTISIIEVADEDTPLTQDQIDKLNSGKYWLKELENGVLYQTVFNIDMYTYLLMCLDGINDEDIYIRYFWLDDIHAGDSISDFTDHSLWFTKVIANPLNNSGTNLEGVQIGDTKYKIPTSLELIDFGINTSTAIGSSNLAKLQEGKAILSFIYDEMPFIYYPISGDIMLRVDNLDNSICYMYWFDPQDLTSNSTCNSIFNLETNYDINLVEANPTLAGTENALTGIKIGNTKYKIPTTPLLEEITWSALKTLRDSSQLVPGRFYRITDYTCTTAQENTSSAGHVFDIIVRADSVNKLNEVASAIQHTGDTYFASNNLSAWKLWYCLDNDTNRFGWVDGYGIVIDGVIYVRNSSNDNTNRTYGYAWSNGSTNRYTDTDDPTTETKAYSSQTGGTEYSISSIHQESGKGVIYRMIDEFNNDVPYDFKNILFTDNAETSRYQYTNAYTFSFGRTNQTQQDLSVININIKCYNNKIGKYVASNQQLLNFNVFLSWENFASNAIYDNVFESNCHSNTLWEGCCSNKFGSECYSNTFAPYCRNITFGFKCYSNIIDVAGTSIVFGRECHSNLLENYCVGIILGESCESNSFDNQCYHITMGGNCSNNVFGASCQYNIFGHGCSYNTLGYSYSCNTFGNGCRYNTFNDSSSRARYCRYNKVDNGCSYLYINGNGTASESNQLQNVHIHLGVSGSSSTNRRTITVDRGLSYITDIYPIGSVEQYV